MFAPAFNNALSFRLQAVDAALKFKRDALYGRRHIRVGAGRRPPQPYSRSLKKQSRRDTAAATGAVASSDSNAASSILRR
jgi:hypothetical protein